jgi:hypothetical protein
LLDRIPILIALPIPPPPSAINAAHRWRLPIGREPVCSRSTNGQLRIESSQYHCRALALVYIPLIVQYNMQNIFSVFRERGEGG